jgi:hypothetical protein
MASIRFSRQAHGADVREQAVVAAMNSVPQARQVLWNTRRAGMMLANGLGGFPRRRAGDVLTPIGGATLRHDAFQPHRASPSTRHERTLSRFTASTISR